MGGIAPRPIIRALESSFAFGATRCVFSKRLATFQPPAVAFNQIENIFPTRSLLTEKRRAIPLTNPARRKPRFEHEKSR